MKAKYLGWNGYGGADGVWFYFDAPVGDVARYVIKRLSETRYEVFFAAPKTNDIDGDSWCVYLGAGLDLDKAQALAQAHADKLYRALGGQQS